MDENTNSGQFTMRLRKGDWELEISAPEKDFVLDEWERLAASSFSVVGVSPNSGPERYLALEPASNGGDFENLRNAKPQTLIEFMRQFKFQNNLEKTLALGYWCEVRLLQSGFTRDDIRVKYKEAKEPEPSNIGRDLGNLVSKGLLLQSSQPSEVYELTNTGLREIEQKLSGQS